MRKRVYTVHRGSDERGACYSTENRHDAIAYISGQEGYVLRIWDVNRLKPSERIQVGAYTLTRGELRHA